MGASRKPNDYSGKHEDKLYGSPESYPGCLGYYTKTMKCRLCKYHIICQKVVSRAEVEKLLQQLLEIATKGAVK